ncbi:MAG: MFS transporter, partial [Eggerthellaceae bacterium]|nr:MFS transporter [Eggerthellaceae bacterium]
KLGRRRKIFLSALIFFIGPLLSVFSINFIRLVAASAILCLTEGASSSLISAYLSEIAPSRKDGR